MSERIVLNPVTRISGFLEIDVTIENKQVIDASSIGLFFRGFEKMLVGRHPFDAVYFTERICGICSSAHGIASTMALENAMGIVPSEQGRIIRDIIHCCEFLQNHIRQFYQFTVPGFVLLPQTYPLFNTNNTDFRIPLDLNSLIQQHYMESLEISRKAHQCLAIFGGKAPHAHGVFIGGGTSVPTVDKILAFNSLLDEIDRFIIEKMVSDAEIIARYYNDYYQMGGSYGNLLSYGCFNNYKNLGTLYLNPSVYRNGEISALEPANITEEIDYSWYVDPVDSYSPFETIPTDDMNKPDAYSWIKSSKYRGLSYETGPLARQWLSGAYQNGISAMDRTMARVLEAMKIVDIAGVLVNSLIPGTLTQDIYQVPDVAEGAGLIDTARGSLGHWLKINNSRLSFYQVITPSVWNLSSRGNDGQRGTVEQALIGTYIENSDNPVEIGRIIRSYDPCVSCATHVYYNDRKDKIIPIMP